MTPPPAWAVLEAALRRHQPVTIHYHGHARTICPHALGWKNNRALLLGYQTDGHSTSGLLDRDPRRRWRNFFVDHIDAAQPAPGPWQSADNYNPDQPFNAIDRVALAITTPGAGTVR